MNKSVKRPIINENKILKYHRDRVNNKFKNCEYQHNKNIMMNKNYYKQTFALQIIRKNK